MRRLAIALFPMLLAAQSNFDRLVDRYFNEFVFPNSPTGGTAAGFHQYDTKLEDYSQAAVQKQTAQAHQFLAELEKFPMQGLSPAAVADWELLIAKTHAALLELENIQQWRRNPDVYSSGITNSAFVIMSRNFASQDERLRSLIAREKQMPQVFTAAKANLQNPPEIYTKVAIEQLPGIVGFFQNDVPKAFDKVKDQKLLAEFKTTNAAVISALQEYEKFLKTTLLPKSKGDFRIGADNYRKKLLYDEMVDIPLERLLEIGMADLKRNQQAFQDVSRKLDAKQTPQQLLTALEKEHPPAGKLLQSFRDTLGGLKQFIEQKHIVTIPSLVLPILEETPPFMRALTTASMDTPGAYETKAKEAFFNVTLPEKNWSAQQTEELMAGFNKGVIMSTAIHEAYPGHYVQFLWVQQIQDKTRKLMGCGSNIEGWAHYTEQMMLEQGYGNGDLKLRLGQLQDALLRDARYIVGIKMHTGQMTFEQAVDFFQKEGYQTKGTAEKETKRGTSDPTYLVYTLGKLQILKLRDDYKAKMGAKFNLQEFHDQFMKQGLTSNKLIRRALLGNDSPTL